ncbi:cytochrome P450 714C2-like [Henckelia pumila]|uniref:cytochrome P450 714C2-like n=1 Tax=Henckelia pumila TaxID=405737 RepID=UPI003C6E3244
MIFSLVLCVCFLIAWLLDSFLGRPKRLRSKLEKQGIRGPSPSLLYGNLAEIKKINNRVLENLSKKPADSGEVKFHSWPSTALPHLLQWIDEYGPIFVYATGNIQILCVTDSDMVKEISLCTSLDLGKPSYLSKDRGPLLGRGILTSNGPYWAHQRKIIAPEFYLDKVKGMVNMMAESTLMMLESWETKAEDLVGKLEVKVDEDLRKLSADIISRACFGSSYAKGEKIFSALHALQRVMSKVVVGVPGSRHLPNKHNKEIWKLESEINSMILEVVKEHNQLNGSKKDLLQLILIEAEKTRDANDVPEDVSMDKFIVDNCKNIYFAGHETTAISAAWCFMTLASYPEWQARARAEVLEICGRNAPDADMLRNMKTLTMVIQETLRLYPPVAFVVREALQDIKFKGIHVPKGVNVQIPISILHQKQDLWGSDATLFKPDRFAKGIARACKIPQAYLPFGVGARTCLGQNFAMMELKVILSLVLAKFSFSLATTYRHSPVFRLVILPEFGVNITVEKL